MAATETATLHLRRFLPRDAQTVADWVEDDRELLWLAPSTPAPLTAEKVLAWTQERGKPFVMCGEDEEVPLGYAELNPLRNRANHRWIGHIILAPAWRRRGLGVSFIRLLLDHAFHDLRADLVSLIVFPNNRQAIRCYLEAGFKFQEEQYHQFGQPAKSYRMLHLVSAPPVPAKAQ
jgi:RimJ/RimL family protein N-acetyltransferase